MAIHIHFAGSYLGGVRFEIPEVFNADLVFCAYDRDEDVAKAGWPITDAGATDAVLPSRL